MEFKNGKEGFGYKFRVANLVKDNNKIKICLYKQNNLTRITIDDDTGYLKGECNILIETDDLLAIADAIREELKNADE